jgi:hypothetical protein
MDLYNVIIGIILMVSGFLFLDFYFNNKKKENDNINIYYNKIPFISVIGMILGAYLIANELIKIL